MHLLRTLIVKLLIWWTIRGLRKSFIRIATMPPDEALLVITRWRWQITHDDDLHPEVRDEYLLALARLEEIVKAGDPGQDLAEAA